jgi:hypothetical protein
MRNDLLSPQLNHTATRHVIGLVEDTTGLLASIACSNEFRDESVEELAAEGFVPFWGRGRHCS